MYYPTPAIAIRDGTYDRLNKLGIFKTVYKCRTKPLKTEDEDERLPNVTIWSLGDETEAMGDANCGAPAFNHRLRLAIEITVVAGDEEHVDADCVALTEQCKLTLLSDTSWLNLFEAVEKIDTDYKYPSEGEQYLVHSVINIEVMYRSIWDPRTPFDFDSMVAEFRPGKDRLGNPVYIITGIPKKK